MQEHLKIAYSRKALETFGAVEKRDIADVFQTDFTDVAAVVVTDEDGDALRNPRIHAFEIPVFLILSAAGKKHDELIGQSNWEYPFSTYFSKSLKKGGSTFSS